MNAKTQRRGGEKVLNHGFHGWARMGMVVAALWLCAAPAGAAVTTGATITNEFRGSAYRLPGFQIKWENLSAPYVAADETWVTREPQYTQLTNGFLNATLYGGTYRITAGNSSQEVLTGNVPFDGGTYPFHFILTNTTVRYQTGFAGRVPVYAATNVAGDGVGLFRTNAQGVLEFLRITVVGGSITNQGNTNIVITITGGGGGGTGEVSTAQLLVVSNLLWNLNTTTSNGIVDLHGPQIAGLSNLVVTSSNAIIALHGPQIAGLSNIVLSVSNAIVGLYGPQVAGLSNLVVTSSNAIIALHGPQIAGLSNIVLNVSNVLVGIYGPQVAGLSNLVASLEARKLDKTNGVAQGSITISSTNAAGEVVILNTNNGAVVFTLPGTWGASNVFVFKTTNWSAGHSFFVESVSGNLVTLTNGPPPAGGGSVGTILGTNGVTLFSSNSTTVYLASNFRPGGIITLTTNSDGSITIGAASASAAFSSTNITVSATNNVIWDMAAFDVARIYLLTNLNALVLSNVSTMGERSQGIIQQDTNGFRSVGSFLVAGGVLQTNANMTVTTNANGVDLLEVMPGFFSTNAFAWWPQNFQPRVAFTNSLASGAGGGGAFDPDSVTGALFTLKNTSVSGANGVEWTNWVDSSGNGYDFTNAPNSASGFNAPYVTNTTFNSKPAVMFADNLTAETRLQSKGAALTAPYTLMVVAVVSSTNADKRMIDSTTQNSVVSFSRSAANSVFANGNIADYVPTANTPHTAFLRVDANSLYVVDGVDRTATTTARNFPASLVLGWANHAEESDHRVFEVRAWSRGLTTNEMNSLGAWAQTNFAAATWNTIP
jgi:hypothetical protein